MARLEAVVIRCADPARLASFYAVALGLPIDAGDAAAIAAGTLGPDEGVLLGSRDGLHLCLIRGKAEPSAPPRLHLDVRLDDSAERDTLIGLGATHRWHGTNKRWEVLGDPEGNPFCVFPPAALP